MALRRQWRSCRLDSTPARVREISTSGNSKDAPNASDSKVTNPRYRSMVMTAVILAVPANPRRNSSPFGSVRRANHTPRANRTTDVSTNGMANRRSRSSNPGVTNLQNWYITTGRAIRNASAAVVLIFTRKGSTMLR